MPVTVPCGQCIGCRLENSRQWAMRCMNEADMSYSGKNTFITLTYDNENIPNRYLIGHDQEKKPIYGGQLVKEHFQLFMKRLRKKYVPLNPYDKKTQEDLYNKHAERHRIKFYHCGEYGEKYSRPHYHAIIFNHDFEDKVESGKNKANILYTSKELSDLWPFGIHAIGAVTFESVAYCARYVTKKINGKLKEEHYKRFDINQEGEIVNEFSLKPEYATMSTKPAIGLSWYEKYKSDCFPSDKLPNKKGVVMRPPDYYFGKYELEEPDNAEKLKVKRKAKAKILEKDNNHFRLNQKHKVALAGHKRVKRSYENDT